MLSEREIWLPHVKCLQAWVDLFHFTWCVSIKFHKDRRSLFHIRRIFHGIRIDSKFLKIILKKCLTNPDACANISELQPNRSMQRTIVGVDCDEGPPVPIPNTEVKLICADNTWRATAREDR